MAFGPYTERIRVALDMWIMRKSMFYLSANLEFIYYDHPDVMIIFRHLMAYFEERSAWPCSCPGGPL